VPEWRFSLLEGPGKPWPFLLAEEREGNDHEGDKKTKRGKEDKK